MAESQSVSESQSVAESQSKIFMDLWIDTQSNRVLFAEVGKDCVDFLFHILSLPIATAINLVSKEEMPGSVANVYKSIENLTEPYMQPELKKDILLKPMSVAREPASVPLLNLNNILTEMKLYTCSVPHPFQPVSEDTRAVCPICEQNINLGMTYVAPPTPLAGEEWTECGYVDGLVKYMVMDNLAVKSMCTKSYIMLINQLGVKDVSSFVEKQVILGPVEAVKLLKTCLHSKNVLTEVFLNQG